MKSRTTRRFRALLAALSADVQRRAKESYRLFAQSPQHPGLHFKKVHASEAIYSVRIDRSFRAVGILERDTIVWFWIGSHEDYELLLASL